MSEFIKISVVIPMYNSEATIRKCLLSVINQSYSGLIEIVVVNDGSTDNAIDVVNDVFSNYLPANITTKILTKENGGVSTARNLGVIESSYDWIALLDSDDIWAVSKLETQVQFIQSNPLIEFVGSNRNSEQYPYFNKSSKPIYTINTIELLLKWYPQTSTALVKKQALIEVGLYDETRTHAEDGDLWLKLSNRQELNIINEHLVITGEGKENYGESGLSANLPKMHEGELSALKGALHRAQIGLIKYYIFFMFFKAKYFLRLFEVRFLR